MVPGPPKAKEGTAYLLFTTMTMSADRTGAGPLCTRAITGPDHPAHQPIYVCETCQLIDEDGASPLPACICESCAFDCHADHEVYYVGVGPCVCDCPLLSMGRDAPAHECRLRGSSAREAERLGLAVGRPLNSPIPLIPPAPFSEAGENNVDEGDGAGGEDGNPKQKVEGKAFRSVSDSSIEPCSTVGGYIYESLTLPALAVADEGGDICRDLIRQAEALADCSKDTFWVPGDASEYDGEEWCDLEILARQIYRRHVHAYSLQTLARGDGRTTPVAGGAEWWVQVKPAGMPRAPVDLHYDKDEALAEAFGLGSFPTLSTVRKRKSG